jgi:glycosyltransferase involved in cell wall biosynthesis
MNNISLPEISVIMPVYNAEKYLKESIDSVLNQTFSNFELIILNDKSTDSSKVIIESYLAKDSRIVFVDKENNVGPASLRNEGFDLARGVFIALLDADDIAKPKRFEKQIAILKNNQEIGVCGSWFTSFGDNEKSIVIQHPEKHKQIKVNFLIDCTIGNSTAFFKKEILKENRYDKDYVPVEDFHLWSRLITQTQFYIIQESLVEYRIHDTNISQTKIDNVKRSKRRIKIGLLKHLGIEENNQLINSYLYLIEGQKGLDFEEIKLVSECYNDLIYQNHILGNFDATLLEKLLQKAIGRIIRKASKQNYSQIKFYKEKFAQAYSKLDFTDKILIYIKAILG